MLQIEVSENEEYILGAGAVERVSEVSQRASSYLVVNVKDAGFLATGIHYSVSLYVQHARFETLPLTLPL